MSKLKKLLSIFIILLVIVLPWRVAFAEVTDAQIKAAKDYHALIIYELFPNYSNTPAGHLVYLQTVINGAQEETLHNIQTVFSNYGLGITNGDIRHNILAITQYLQNPPVRIQFIWGITGLFVPR